MQISVGTTAAQLPVDTTNRPIIQNLGPGDLYWDYDAAVTTTTGVKVAVGGTYEFTSELGLGGGPVYLVASVAATDVRYALAGN